MSGLTSFGAAIDLPDGRRINVSIDIPAGHPVTHDYAEYAETSEIAQMAAAHALRVMTRSDESRARRARRARRDRDEVPF